MTDTAMEATRASVRPRRLGAILFDGFELLDFYGPLEMFGCLGPDLSIETLAEVEGPVQSSAGPQTLAQHAFADCPDFDLYLIPGGQGVFREQDNEAMLSFLRDKAARAEVMMTVCNGAALPARAGLLDGRRATTNKIFFDSVEAQGPDVEWIHEARWVEDGPFVTASGVSAGIDMALAVIARLFGLDRAEAVAILTEYEWKTDAARDPFHVYLNQTRWIATAIGAPTATDSPEPSASGS
jgi:transcriptional regulator GlxA family with amidase domain